MTTTKRKGIVLAGGSGTRLYPSTKVVCKQLLPVYDKPMIYYPISSLMMSGVQEILIITTPHDLPLFKHLLGDGKQWGISFEYAVQPHPGGLAQAYQIGASFIGKSDSILVLGDNVFYGHDFIKSLHAADKNQHGATVFGYYVKDPERYGVVGFDKEGNANSIEEKPKNPKSNYAVVGLYFYDNQVIDIVKNLKPSPRGELEITDVNAVYLTKKQLKVEKMGRGIAWLDMGTHDSLLQASQFIQTVEERQGLKICCPEEIAFRNKWISAAHIEEIGMQMKNNGYGQYLLQLLKEID